MSTIVKHASSAHQFTIDIAGQQAVLDYQIADGRLLMTHTFVPDALRGQGLAAALVRAALEFARDRQLKVVPVCTYAASFMNSHPEYASLLQ